MKYNFYINKWLTEAIVMGIRPDIDPLPLKDTDVVRVYHGFENPLNAVKFCKYGVSGKELISRNYSYESNNNPYGLFVTGHLKTAKRFTSAITLGKNEYDEDVKLAVILEFQTKAFNLESPVWPGGSYTGWGQYSQYWSGENLSSQMKDREKARLKNREDILQSHRKDLEFAKLSDRPELALSLFYSGEYQALFVGDLNPNMIRAVWVFESGLNPQYGDFKRMNRNDFLKKYEYLLSDKKFTHGTKKDASNKVYLPTDDWKGIEDFVERFSKKQKYKKEDIENYIQWALKNNKDNLIDQLEQNLWPKQLKQAIIDLELDPEQKYFIPEAI